MLHELTNEFRLRQEKVALEALLRPPSVLELTQSSRNAADEKEMLSEEDIKAWQSLAPTTSGDSDTLTRRLNKVINGIEPAIDTFADGIHKINQYRIGGDSIASQVLATCATKLAERERVGRLKALGQEHDRSPGRDLGQVLRGLSKIDK